MLIVSIAGCSGNRNDAKTTASVATSVNPASVAPGGPTSPRPSTGIRFEDVAAQSGINLVYPQFQKPLRILETLGFGCAALDYDNDGWMDILLVSKPNPRLYRNRGGMKFQDVTSAVGLDKARGEWTGCAVGDYDGDGHLDILLTGYRCLALMRNVDGHRFENVTVAAGLDPVNHNHWGTSAGFMDLDGSGRMSLVLLNYVIFGPREPQYCEFVPGVKSGCAPSSYRPEFPEIWRNVGGGRFRDATQTAGMNNAGGITHVHGKALVVAFNDYDNDGKMDFYIGNDGTPADLMHNEGGFRFKNQAVTQGVSVGVNQEAEASMGADWADYTRCGRQALFTSAFSNEPYSLYQNVGAYFENMSVRTGLAEPTRKPLGFGAKFVDVDNDGWPDLVIANGHVYDNVDRVYPGQVWRQPSMLFHNINGKRFEDVAPSAGAAFTRPIVGRGLATADFDNDGLVDILIVDMNGAPLLLHNRSVGAGHWVQLALRGTAPNVFAYGAHVTLKFGGALSDLDVSPASSYLSSSSPIIHFGLGAVNQIDSLIVRWSDGNREQFPAPAIDKRTSIVEGRGRPAAMVH